ncbi:MAG: hypothetical protein ABIN18_22350 [Pseudomonadota bacterium]
MGTDIYLDWNGRTRKDKEKQITGFDINAGNAGYLRASIGMTTENAFLRGLFASDYWEAGKPLRYHFTEEGYKKLHMAGLAYLASSITGKEIEHPEMKAYHEFGNQITEIFKGMGFDEVQKSDTCNFRHAVMWLNSVFSFYELGLQKEKQGLEPKVYISW